MKSITLQLTDSGWDAVTALQTHFQLSEPQEVFLYALSMLQMAIDDKKINGKHKK